MATIGRNNPCPCGSGKKHKNCCINKEIEQLSEESANLPKKRINVTVNKTISIDKTIGTGLATLLAKNLELSDVDLPEKEKMRDSDIEVLPKLRDLLGYSIKVKPLPDGSVSFGTKGGVIILKP